ncbi:protein of unknown function [uncultured Sphingopyxis sp.]|uniref:Transposase n=1 Tax=uncultured Sphingopyxis sp. TaxID=310581 RepID=A0A1Y5PZ55_9SPHN|nr:protein of unknown function [uncultured Sphingopyxis sp.]
MMMSGSGVGIVECWLFGRLRNRVFHGLAELNGAIAALMRRLNDGLVLRQGAPPISRDIRDRPGHRLTL